MAQVSMLKKIIYGGLTKYPRCNGWQNKKVSDKGKIDGIETNGGAHSGPNGDMFVVDIDQVANTLEIWHSLVEKYGLHKDVPHQLTTTGGHHYLFNYKPELLQKSIAGVLVDRSLVSGITERDGKFYDSKGKQLLCKKVGDTTLLQIGIDFLSDRCQIVIAPSSHVCNKKKCNSPCQYIGKRYTWLTGPPAGKTRSDAVEAFQAAKYDLPDWLMRLYKKTAFVGPNYELLPLSAPAVSVRAKPTIAVQPRAAPQAQLHVGQSKGVHEAKLDFIWTLCECLDAKRVNERESWIKLGMILKNELDEAGFDYWYELSDMHYEDCDESEHERIWSSMGRQTGPHALGIATLIMWAREDLTEDFGKCEELRIRYGHVDNYIRSVFADDEVAYQNKIFEHEDNGYYLEQISQFFGNVEANEPLNVYQWALGCVREVINGGSSLYVVKTRESGYKVVDHFSKSFLNKVLYKVKMKGKKSRVVTFAKVVESLSKYMYESVQFISPNPKVFNSFRGFAAAKLQNGTDVDITPIKEHIFHVLCASNTEVYKYVMSWMANLIQNPDRKTGICLNIVGKQGSGKSCILNFLADKVIGADYALSNATVDSVLGNFNGIVENKLLIILNELKNHSTSPLSDKFKALITDRKLVINKKNARMREVDNFANFICVSNNRNAVRVTEDDRRFLCLETSNKFVGNTEYFDRLYSVLDDPGAAKAFHDYLATRENLVDLRKIPATGFKKELIKASRPIAQEWFHLVEEGEIDFPHGIVIQGKKGNIAVYLKDMYDEFLDWMKKYKSGMKCSRSTFMNDIAKVIGCKESRLRVNGRDAKGWKDVPQWKKSYNADSNDE